MISISFAVDLLLYPIHAIWGSNLWVFHVFTLLEYSLLVLVFSYWQKTDILRKALRLSIPVFALIWILAKFYVEDLTSFDNFTSSLENAVIIGVSGYALLELGKEDLNSLSREPRFWVSSGVLIYFAGNLILFAISSVIMMWWTHNVLRIIYNLCQAGGFLCLRRR